MHAVRSLGALVLSILGSGCPSPTAGADAGPDALPLIMAERFTSTTWSLAVTGDAAQLSITDGTGTAACALSTDHHQGLGSAGVQILVGLPGPVTGTCPAGDYVLKKCPAELGTGAYVPAGCAFFRRWNPDGTTLGIAAAINGVITIQGTASSCSIIASVGFVGASFAERYTLNTGTGTQPWCKSN